MRKPLAILLATLLLLQLGTDAAMIQWQRYARESFAALFCTNRATEVVPMCYGSCQLPDLFDDLTDDGSDHDTVTAPTPLAACLPASVLTLHLRPAAHLPERRTRPLAVPRLYGGDYRATPLQPPTA